jgi:thioredoxin reductase
MTKTPTHQVVIIGGGTAGHTAAIHRDCFRPPHRNSA